MGEIVHPEPNGQPESPRPAATGRLLRPRAPPPCRAPPEPGSHSAPRGPCWCEGRGGMRRAVPDPRPGVCPQVPPASHKDWGRRGGGWGRRGWWLGGGDQRMGLDVLRLDLKGSSELLFQVHTPALGEKRGSAQRAPCWGPPPILTHLPPLLPATCTAHSGTRAHISPAPHIFYVGDFCAPDRLFWRHCLAHAPPLS